MRSLFIAVMLLLLSNASVHAQPIEQNSTIPCVVVTKKIAKLHNYLELGTCAAGCSGCGCQGGPGYRAQNGRCVGFSNIIAKCGPPPHHVRCKAECVPVAANCTHHGRAWLVAKAEAFGITVEFRKPDDAPRFAPEPVPEKKPPPPIEFKPLPEMAVSIPSLRPIEASGILPVGTQRSAVPNTPPPNCNIYKRCTEMSSCNEAWFYFSKCGHTGLDGNNNGIPCDAICR